MEELYSSTRTAYILMIGYPSTRSGREDKNTCMSVNLNTALANLTTEACTKETPHITVTFFLFCVLLFPLMYILSFYQHLFKLLLELPIQFVTFYSYYRFSSVVFQCFSMFSSFSDSFLYHGQIISMLLEFLLSYKASMNN